MSYQVLARKWRPRSFREMVGQTHVLKALINALDHQRLHHAYLFTGTRGVGKTTIARIMAKCLNCEQGISSTPCGECSICREIDEGRFVDLIEVDAASKTKVEDTREMLDNVQYMPTRGRYKVYLIDEVHMLSTSSFNALLKTLEEPPPYVKFLLATTDPQKLPPTVLSRCLQFSLKNMPPEPIVGHLQNVLTSENIPFEDDALWLLGRAADGSMRDAMSLTDQAVSFGDGRVFADDVRAMLGTLDQGQIYGVLKALIAGDAREALSAVAHLAEHGPDWAGVLAEILNALHRIAIAQLLPDAIDNGQGDRAQVLELAAIIAPEDVQFYYQLGLIGRRDLPLAPDPRDGFEMVLLRMLAFRPASLPGTPGTPLIQSAAVTSTAATATSAPSSSAVTATVQPEVVSSAAPAAPAVVSNAAVEQHAAVSSPTQPSQSVVVESEPTVAPEVQAAEVMLSPPTEAVEHIHAPWEEQPAAAVVPETVDTAVESTESPPTVIEQMAIAAEQPNDAEVFSADATAEIASAANNQEAAADYQEQDYSQAFAAESESTDDDESYLEAEPFQAYDYVSSLSEDDAKLAESNAHLADLQPSIPVATGLAAEWQALFAQLKLAGMTGSIAANCVLMEKNASAWLLHLDPNHSALFNNTQLQRISDAINAQLPTPIELSIEVHAIDQESPALALLRKQAKRQQEAEAAIHTDPIVLQLMDTFGAIISAESIQPIDSVM